MVIPGHTNMAKSLVSLGSFVLRHLAASIMSITVPLVAVTCIYFVLFAYAILTNQGLGSPIAYPIWLLVALIASLLYTACLLFPSVALGELVSKRIGKWKYPAQVIVSSFILAIFVFGLDLIWHNRSTMAGFDLRQWLTDSALVFGVLLIPLGIYWWTCKVVQAGTGLPRLIFNFWKRSTAI